MQNTAALSQLQYEFVSIDVFSLQVFPFHSVPFLLQFSFLFLNRKQNFHFNHLYEIMKG